MKKIELNKDEESKLAISDFVKRLNRYQHEYRSDIPVIAMVSKPKAMMESLGSTTRIINMNQYGNARMDAFSFYKSISTIISDDD